MQPNDLKNLVALKSCIEINYARLASCKLESEMSNTIAMKQIELKFPLSQQVEWIKWMSHLPQERQVDTFPEFLKWLDEAAYVWSTMESKESVQTSPKYSKSSTTLYSGDGDAPVETRLCFTCRKQGHIQVNCPDFQSAGTGPGHGDRTAGRMGGKSYSPKH